MILSNKVIVDEMKKGNIIIHPFKKENLTTSSYDVSIGECYYRECEIENNFYDIYNEKHTKEIFGDVEKAKKWEEAWDEVAGFPLCAKKPKWLKPSDRIIFIRPGETILAHTQEFIGGKDHITTMMKARSSLGRNFIGVCKCAGWGDVGFTNRWTMEITNFSQHHIIPLVVGRRIAQVIFLETYPLLEEKTSYAHTGKYQTGLKQTDIEKNWKPESMLPRLYKDNSK